MKVAINVCYCYGGFGLSKEAAARLSGKCDHDHSYEYDDEEQYRACPALIEVIEELGAAANGFCARLRVVEVPDDVKWHIHEYDGNEHIAEDHRTWS